MVARLAGVPRWNVLAGTRRAAVMPSGVTLAVTPSLEPKADWSTALRGVKVVLHAAARVHVMKESAGDALATYRRVNVEGTLGLARQAALAGVRRFVFLSSIKVNGESTTADRPFTRADIPAPEDAYGISKAEAECGLFAIGRETGMEIVVVRPPLVYGPGVAGNFVRLLRWVERGVPLPLGAIDNRRSLVAVENLVDLLVRCLDHPGAAGEILLVSDGEDLSTTELIRRMAAALDTSPRLYPVPVKLLRLIGRATAQSTLVGRLVDSLQVDSAYTCERLGWTPPIDVAAGLRQAGQWYSARRTSR